MIIVTIAAISQDALDRIVEHVEQSGLKVHLSRGEHRIIVGCIGDEDQLDEHRIASLEGVERVLPVLKPYKLASREFRVGSSHVACGGLEEVTVGGAEIVVIAGPCSVEGSDMMIETAKQVKDAGARMLRGGAFKPRSSPYAFQGMGEEGLQILAAARVETGLPVVTEVLDPRQVELVASYSDVLQIGARNMQNYALLNEVGRTRLPILLKRGLSATITELLMSAEYVMSQGNDQVILCERGIRTYETATRNTLDIAAIPVLKRETHLPVVVDPSHAGGRADLVTPLAMASIAAGADGLIVEVHPEPAKARSDGDQSLTPAGFAEMMTQVQKIVHAVSRTMNSEVMISA